MHKAVCVVLLLALLNECNSTFIDHPIGGSALTNSPRTLSCLVHDQLPLPTSIVWCKDGLPKSSDDRIQISYDSTTGESTYNILNVLYADGGNYSCKAYNSSNNLLYESDTGSLTVQGRPAFDPPLQPKTVTTASNVVIKCTVISNPPTSSLTWTFNDNELENSARITVDNDQVTITNVQSADDGYYTCSAENSYGTNKTSAKLTVKTVSNPDVSIAEAPLNPSDPYALNEGESIVLHCNVEGEEISNVQWKNTKTDQFINNGVTVTSDGSTLSFTSIADENEAVYECSANTSSGGYDSATINIIVHIPPVAELSSTSSVIRVVGEPFNGIEDAPFCFYTKGDGVLTYKWTFNDGEVQSFLMGNVSVLGLIPDSLKVSNAGIYTCTVSNDGGSSSVSFELIIQYGPTVETPLPFSLQAVQGDDFFIPCTFDADPPATVTWTKDGNSVTSPNSQTADGITLFGVLQSDGGTYTCTGGNFLGSIASQGFLSISNGPAISFINPSSDFYQSVGSTLNIQCQFSAPTDSVISWYHNGLAVDTSDSRVTVVVQPAFTSLSVSELSFDDAGTYLCNVSYLSHNDISSVTMSISVAPVIVVKPLDLNVTQNEPTLIQCEVSAVPMPTIIWFWTDIVFNFEQVVEDDGESFRYETKGLRLLTPQRSNTGTYSCLASVPSQPILSASAFIIVEGEPEVTSITPTQLISGQKATLTCTAQFNYPPSTFNWTQGNGDLPVNTTRFTVYNNGELVISPVIPTDHQTLTCHAQNSYGSSMVSQGISVDVSPTVSFSHNSVHLVLNTNLTVTCSAFSRPGAVFEVYLPSGSKALSFQFSSSTGLLDISKITPSLRGTYTCFGTNYLGTDNDTLLVTVVGSPPSNVTVYSDTPTSVTVSWLHPPDSLSDSLMHYNLWYQLVDGSGRLERNVAGTSLVLEGLEEYTGYQVEIRAVYEEEVTSGVVYNQVMTLQDAPSASPKNVSLVSLEQAIQIDWEAPEAIAQNGVIEGYNIWFRTSRIDVATNGSLLYNETFELLVYLISSDTEEGTPLQYNLTNLDGGTSYDVVLQAFTLIGNGPGSDIVTAEAKKPFPLTAILASVVPIGTLIVVGLLALLVVGLYFGIRKLKKAGKFSIRSAEEGKAGKRRKRKRRNIDISDPLPEYPPEVDMTSKKSKFTLHHADGSTIPSHPKVIKPSDVEKKRRTGAKIVSRRDSVISDPYEDPDEIMVRKKGRKKSRDDSKREGFAPRDSRESKIYEEPKKRGPKQPPQKPKRSKNLYGESDNEEDAEDIPEEMPVAFAWGSEEQDEDDDDDYSDEEEPEVVLRNKKSSRGNLQSVAEESEEEEESSEEEEESEDEPSPPPRRRNKRQSDTELMYSTVSDQYRAQKRSKMLEEKMKEQEKARKEREKMEAKKRKEEQKLQKKQAEAKKKEMKKQQKERLRRQSLGLDNIMDMAEIGGSRGMSRSRDVSSASLF